MSGRLLGVKSGTLRSKLHDAFSEVKSDPPSIVARTRKKKGVEAAKQQSVAIALSKARQSGAPIPYAGVRRGTHQGGRA